MTIRAPDAVIPSTWIKVIPENFQILTVSVVGSNIYHTGVKPSIWCTVSHLNAGV